MAVVYSKVLLFDPPLIYTAPDTCVFGAVTLSHRRNIHLLLFMHKQTTNNDLLKRTNIRTRLHQAPVFKTYKPNNEKARQNILYRGASLWNELPSNDRNLDFKTFKTNMNK